MRLWICIILLALTAIGCAPEKPNTHHYPIKHQPVISRQDMVFTPYFMHQTLALTISPEYEMIAQWDKCLYRKHGSKAFKTQPYTYFNLHKIVYNPFDSLYYGVEGDSAAIVVFKDLSDSIPHSRITHLAGVSLEVPHDIEVDTSTGWVYVLDAVDAAIYRFKAQGKIGERLALAPPSKGYLRSFSIIDSALYIPFSTEGHVLEIRDFADTTFVLHQAKGHQKRDMFGAWHQNGLLPVDIAFYNGYYYLSNNYRGEAIVSPSPYLKNRLIRFRTWEDFAHQRWEEVGFGLDSLAGPYNLTVHDGSLYVCCYRNQPVNEHCWLYKINAPTSD